MWMPVLESGELKTDPVRVSYWGTPLVLFRTASGRLAALEDKCAHRGVPLSRGSIRDENIRCGFHHFRFNADGECVDVPSAFGADEAFRSRCSVRKFFVREEIGLVWVSVEDESSSPFPVDLDDLPEDRVVVTGAFDAGGDIRIWMDHFLDMMHMLWAHAESSFFGSAERPADVESPSIGITADSHYPVRPGVELDYLVRPESPDARYALPIRTVMLLTRIRRRLRGGAGTGRAYRMHGRADLLTPVCQDTWLNLGRMPIRVIASMNPIAEGKNRLVYASICDGRGRSRMGRALARRLMRDAVRQHLGVEDHNLLEQTPYLEDEQLNATEFDATIPAMRAVFTAYQRDKAKLYPDDSMIHHIRYGSQPTADV